jgi:hypothetical protein
MVLMRTTVALGLAIAGAAPAFPAERFTYAGIELGTTLAAAKARFPNSKVVGDYVYVADRDRRDQVSGIQLAGTRNPRMVRLSFERPRDAAGRGQPVYPKCKVIESDLRARYGAPDEVRKLAEGAQPRADRIWKGAGETLTLICFAGLSGELLAEAVLIIGR